MIKQEIFYDKGKTRPVTDFELENFEVDEDGQILILGSGNRQEFFIFGDASVQVIDEPGCVYARDNSNVYLKCNARVYSHDNSTVYRHGDPYIDAYSSGDGWEAKLNLRYRRPTTVFVWLFDNSSFCTYSYTTAFLRDSSTVNLYSRSMVWREDPDLPLSVPVLPQVCHCCGREMT